MHEVSADSDSVNYTIYGTESSLYYLIWYNYNHGVTVRRIFVNDLSGDEEKGCTALQFVVEEEERDISF